MSEQDGTKASIKTRRNRHVSKPNGAQKPTLEQPANDDENAWREYWKAQGQTWRTQPEISKERQEYLSERRKIKTFYRHAIYPFYEIKLKREDVEWLLSTHDNGRGPVNWNDESQRERQGLDLSGVDLRKENLSDLPLAKCDFSNGHLQGAFLVEAQLQHSNLSNAQLQQSSLFAAQLQEANLFTSQLQGANLGATQLQGADLGAAKLLRANLREAKLQGAVMSEVKLADEDHVEPQLADVQWGDTNLTVVDWTQITILGDEYLAKEKLDFGVNKKVVKTRLIRYTGATRAYRQLSVVLRNQGLNEDASRFTYRSQLMQRKVFWYKRKFLSYFGSLFLDLLSGYGYKVGRCFIAYALVIGVFAMIYHFLGTNPAWNESIVISMTAFHGRGFFPEQFHPGDPQAMVAAIEAFVGLLIEITLIATMTQRFFGR